MATKKNLQNQGIPEARTAIERNQRKCAAVQQQDGWPNRARCVAVVGLARSLQKSARKPLAKTKPRVKVRTRKLRGQLKALEDELSKL